MYELQFLLSITFLLGMAEDQDDLPWEALLSRFTNTEGRLEKKQTLLLALGVEAAFVMCFCSPKQ